MSRPSSTVLHHAIATGDIETLQTLLKQGSVDADTRLQIDEDVLETASRKSLSSLRSYRQQSMTTNDLIVEEESCDTDGMVIKKDLTIILDQEEDDNLSVNDEVDNDNTKSSNIEHEAENTVSNEVRYDDDEITVSTNKVNENTPTVISPPEENVASPEGNPSITGCSTEGFTTEHNVTNHQTEDSKDSPSLFYSREEEEDKDNIKVSINYQSRPDTEVTIGDNMNVPTTGSKQHQDNKNEVDAIDKIMEECQHEAEEENKEDEQITSTGGYLQETPLNVVSTQEHEAASDDEEELVERRVTTRKMERLKDSRPNSSNFNNNNNDRRSLADTIDLKLRDENEGLFERAPSMRVKEMTEDGEGSSTPKKLIPRLKRKISLKFTNRKPKKDVLEDDGDDFEDEMIYQNLVKTKNVDDEQLNENFEGVAFFEAVRDGMDMIVTTLLETSDNYQLNMLDENGFTPAMQAAWHGQAECLQILINHGANTDLRNATGCTATHFAAGQGRAECLQLLITDDPEQIDTKTKFGATPLILAAKGGHSECVQILLESGADPNIQYRGNQNALLFAAGNGHYDCLEALIEHGVDLNQPNSQKVTPLMRAVQQGHNTCVALLTDKGAGIDLQDAIGRTALHFAIEHNNPKGLKLLLNTGANLELKTKGGSKAYAYAERFHNTRCAEMLENHINKLREEVEKTREVETQKQIVQEKEHNKVSCLSFKHIFRRRSRKNSKTQAPNS